MSEPAPKPSHRPLFRLSWGRRLVLLIGGIMLAGIVVYLAGSRLPIRHIVTRGQVFEVPPQRVWQLIADQENGAPDWRPSVEKLERVGEHNGLPLYRERSTQGTILFTVVERVAPRKLVTRIVENEDFGGTWTFRLRQHPRGTYLAIKEDGEIYNPMMRFFAHYVHGMETTLDQYMADLEAAVAQPAENKP